MDNDKVQHLRNVPKLRFTEFDEEYKLIKIGCIASRITAGGTPSTKEPSYWTPGTVPWMSSGEVNKRILYDTDKKISEEGLRNSSTKMIKNQSVLIALAGQGKTRGMVAINEIPLCTNQSIGAIEVDREYQDYKYLYYNLFKEYEKLRIWSSTGEGRGGINLQFINDWKLNIPSVEEQRKISRFLETIDGKISLLEDKLENLKLFKRGFIQKEVIRKDFDNNTTLRRILKERKKYAINDGKYVHCSLSKDGVNAKRQNENRDFLVKDIGKKYKITELNDICYNPANLKFGVICKNTYGTGIFSPIYVTFEVNKEFDFDFIELVITNIDTINRMRKYEEGTIYERMAVKPFDLLRTNINHPALEVQRIIKDRVAVIDKKIFSIENEFKAFKQFKKGLLQKMFI
jgi:type I restriction enzyme S subunit